MIRSNAKGSAALLGVMAERAEKLREKLIAVRRDLHMYPELSGQEERTASVITQWLRDLGLEIRTGVGGHGVVGIMQGRREEPVVAYRADMDAVCSEVVGDVPYRSQVEGVKHVCGHDVHMAVGLGVATVLASVREHVPGTVLFIFQPAEETLEGARAMLEDGVLDDPTPQAIFALHTAPIPVGKIMVGPGVGATGIDHFEVTLEVEEHLDSLAGEALTALQTVSTMPPFNPADMDTYLANVTTENGPLQEFISVKAWHILDQESSDRRVIQGNVNCSGDDAYARTRRLIRQALEDLTAGKASFTLKFQEPRFLPNMHSDVQLAKAAIPAIEAAIGDGTTVIQYASIPFASEDFAWFLERIPGAMFWLGVANQERGITAINHSPDYDVDEQAIVIGVKAISSILLDFLM